ncbi:MAG: hypothetical protein GX958_11485 [Desulfitobacterium sp.]|nr:hypothetical protein [Desulfitobacterium sp.]
MDATILYVLLSVGIAFVVAYLVSYLRRKELLKQEDLMFAIQALDLSLKIVSEMRLDKEDKIKQISQIVIDSLEFGISLYNTEEDVKANALEYAYELCNTFDIELTDNRKEIIKELIEITFNEKYIDFIEE